MFPKIVKPIQSNQGRYTPYVEKTDIPQNHRNSEEYSKQADIPQNRA